MSGFDVKRRRRSIAHECINVTLVSLVSFFYFISFVILEVLGWPLKSEDIFSFFLLVFLSLYFFEFFMARRRVNTLFVLLLLYVFYYWLITSISYFFGHSALIGLVFNIKEAFYMALGFGWYFIAKNSPNLLKYPMLFIFFGILLNVAWGAYQIISGDMMGHYGISAFGYKGAAASSAALFYGSVLILMLFLLMAKDINFVMRAFVIFLLMACSVMLILVANRTFLLALIVFFLIFYSLTFIEFVSKLLSQGRVKVINVIWGAVFLILTLYVLTYFWDILTGTYGVVSRMENAPSGLSVRIEKMFRLLWMYDEDFIFYLTGHGRGHHELVSGAVGLDIDSQFTRLLIEVGVVGFLMFSILVLAFAFKIFFRNWFSFREKVFFASFLISFVACFISYDVLLISKSGPLFWSIVMFFYGTLKFRESFGQHCKT